MGDAGKTQVHHILPVATVSEYWRPYMTDKAKFDIIKDRYEAAGYCINAKENLLRMPTLPTFVKIVRDGSSPPSPDWPAHLLDHHHYSKELYDELMKVWNGIAAPPPGQPCTTPDKLKTLLEGKAGTFRSRLTTRANRTPNVSTVLGMFQKRQTRPTVWWPCFSMAPDGLETKLYTFISNKNPRKPRR